MSNERELSFETLAIHAGQEIDPTTNARACTLVSDNILWIQGYRACS